MKNLKNKIVAITGAGSGIGQALAVEFAKQGAHLALSDINEQNLNTTVNLLQAYHIKLSFQVLDVSEQSAVEQWADTVVQDHGGVNVIINNAGVAIGATIESTKMEDFQWLMNINFWGVVYGTKSFLPHLKLADEGHIINISSIFGMVGVPSTAAYCAAKFAVRGFTESLRQELEITDSNVSCSCVHPGGIKTNIMRSARLQENAYISDITTAGDKFKRSVRTTPTRAALTIIDGLKKKKCRILIGFDAHLIDLCQRMMPGLYQKVVAIVLKHKIAAGRSIC